MLVGNLQLHYGSMHPLAIEPMFCRTHWKGERSMSRSSPKLEESRTAVAIRRVAQRGATELVEASAAPVFIHSSWRTASTWLWARLRQAPTAIAYCEFFHERLRACTIEYLTSNDFAAWNSKHPESAPYFLEFAPLIESDGAVRGYDPSMAIDRFLPADGPHGVLSLAERAYVEGLIENAARLGKIPILTDTRTLGRLEALAKAFPGHHVLLVRNLFHQWASYSEQCAGGNRYFLDMLFMTVGAFARHQPQRRLRRRRCCAPCGRPPI